MTTCFFPSFRSGLEDILATNKSFHGRETVLFCKETFTEPRDERGNSLYTIPIQLERREVQIVALLDKSQRRKDSSRRANRPRETKFPNGPFGSWGSNMSGDVCCPVQRTLRSGARLVQIDHASAELAHLDTLSRAGLPKPYFT